MNRRALTTLALVAALGSVGWLAVNRNQSSADILSGSSRASAEARSGIIQSFQANVLILSGGGQTGPVTVPVDDSTRIRLAGVDGQYTAADQTVLIPGRLAIIRLEFTDRLQPVGAIDVISMKGAQ